MTNEEATEPTLPETHDPTDYGTVSCRQCGAEMQRRRPSNTGAHFCTKPDCVKAKGRFYHRRRAENAAAREATMARRLAETHQRQLIAFVKAAVHAERADCETCGRPGVIPRYAHPVPDWTAPCNPVDRLPASGDPVLTTELMKAIYPPEGFGS